MNKKTIIKFIIADLIFIILIFAAVKIYNKYKSTNNTQNPVSDYIKSDTLKYKHFNIKLPAGFEYKTDDFYINLRSNEGWETKVDIMVDGNSLMRDNSAEAISDLKVRGYEVTGGPLEALNEGIYFFYYVTKKDSKNHIIAYSYSNLRYLFEVDYDCGNNCENFNPISRTIDIFMNADMEVDPDTEYLFHHFYVG